RAEAGFRAGAPRRDPASRKDGLRGSARPLVPSRSTRDGPRAALHRPRLVPRGRRASPSRRTRVGPRRSRPSALVPAHARTVGARARRGADSHLDPRVRRAHVWLIALAAIVPRVVVLVHERGDILTAFTDKNDDFAQTFV